MVEKIVAAVDAKIRVVIIQAFYISQKVLIVINKLIGVTRREGFSRHAVKSHIVFPYGVHLGHRSPKISLDMSIARRQQIDVVEDPIVEVIFDIIETGALRLDPHVDIFSNEADD